MAYLFIAVPVCVLAIFGSIGLATLYEMLFGEPPIRERDKKNEASNPHDGAGNAPGANHEMEAWLREVDAMERF